MAVTSFEKTRVQQAKAAGTAAKSAYQPTELRHMVKSELREVSMAEQVQAAVAAEREKLRALIAQADDATAALARAGTAMQEFHEVFRREGPKELMEVALLIAERILDHEIHTSSETVLTIAAKICEQVYGERDKVLYLHPEDIAFLQAHCAERLAALQQNTQHITIETDAELPRGNCRLVTPRYKIDGGVMKSLEALWKELVGSAAAGGAPAPVVESSVETPASPKES